MTSDPKPLTHPVDGVPDVITSESAFKEALAALSDGHGPIAADAERASGYRYGQAAYLIQLRREGAGTLLLDPTELVDLHRINAATQGAEWVFHAASQDLPCLRDLEINPGMIFDTEVAGRLLGAHRVGLGSMVTEYLGLQLAKEHSAVDWSRRPIPADWLIYAALDVEVLIDLRNTLESELRAQEKLEWALQEFEAILQTPGPSPKPDPWRRISGRARITAPRQLAIIREMWAERETIAQRIDLAPGRVLPDSAIAAAASAPNGDVDLSRLSPFKAPMARQRIKNWQRAFERGWNLPSQQWPPRRGPAHDGPPQPRLWKEKNPQAYVRLSAAKDFIAELAGELNLPQENLLTPSVVRELVWDPPFPATTEAVKLELARLGARAWQIDLTAEGLTQAIVSDGS